MKKLFFLLTVVAVLSACKGSGSGPLVKDSFTTKTPERNTKTPNANINSEKISESIEPCTDCIKIADLLANKKSYSGKTIKVTGKVTKFNPEIMGKNWIHIQDGSEYKGGYDLTITTSQSASVGDTITFEGKISLDRDFGYGYIYAVLMEDGKPVL
jgi:hypothetical protein